MNDCTGFFRLIRPVVSRSATRNASSSDWLRLSRGSQSVLVAVHQVRLDQVVGTADALGHVVAGQLHVHPPGQVPSSSCTSKKPFSSAITSENARVL